MWLHDLFRPNLGKLAERQDVSGLIAALSHRDPVVQRQATTILRSMGKISIPLLLDALQHGNRDLQQRVAAVLEEIPDIPVENLITALGDDTGHTYPGVAALIASLGDQAVLPLMGALNSESEEVRKGAIVALGMIGEPARPQLLAALMHPSYRIRYGAALALDRTGWTPQGDRERFRYLFATGQWSDLVKMRKAVVLPLIAALDDGHYAVRRDAALALGSIGDLRALDPLQRLLITDPEETVRAAAAEGLGLLVDDQAIPVLRAAVRDHAHSVRMAAALALAKISWIPDDEQEQLALLVATEQWSQLVRYGQAAIPVLISALGDEYYGIRTGSAEALWRIGDSAVEPLIHALRDQNPAIRAGATGVLMRLGAFPKERPAPTYIEQIRPNITPPLHIRREGELPLSWTENLSSIPRAPAPREVIPVGDDLDQILSAEGTEVREADQGAQTPSLLSPDEEDEEQVENEQPVLTTMPSALHLDDETEPSILIPAEEEEGFDTLPDVDLSSLISPSTTEEAVESLDLLDDEELESLSIPGAETDGPMDEPFALTAEDDLLPLDLTPIHPAEGVQVDQPPGFEADLEGGDDITWAPVQESAFLSLMDSLQRTAAPDDEEERSRLITSYLADQHGALSSDQPSVIVSAVGPGLAAEDDAVRMVAAEVLGQIGVASVPLLIAALEDHYYQVRITAADALGQIGDRRALSPLIHLLLGDEEEEVRSRAALALGTLRDPAAVGALVRALHDRYQMVRGSAARALGMIGDRQAIGPLVALFEAGDRATTGEVVRALQVLGAADQLVGETVDPERRRALEGLMAHPGEDDMGGVPARDQQMISPVHEITIPQEGPPPIEVILVNPVPPSAPELIGEPGESLSAPPEDPGFVLLVEASVHEDAGVRRKVAHALAKSPDPRAGDLLITLLADPDEGVRASATEGLGLLGDLAAVPDLIAALGDQSEEVVMQAARSLGELQNPAAATPLIRLLNADDYGIRQVAGEALTALGSGAFEALVEALSDPEKDIRAGSAESLAAAGWRPVDLGEEIGFLIAGERWSEIGCYGEDALPPLARFIDDPDPEIRLGVVSALTKIGGSAAAALLEHAASDPSYMVRKRAGMLHREENRVTPSEPEGSGAEGEHEE